MTGQSFTEEDRDKLIDFLNHIAKKAEFRHNTEEALQYVRLLSHMQQVIIPKINANILEVKNVVEPEKKTL